MEELRANEALKSTLISGSGSFIQLAESQICAMTSSPYAFTTSNGTAALHLALMALGIGPGDEVIVPAFTYIASANAVLYVGAKPIFVDCDPVTWTIDTHAARAAITSATRAIIGVHLYGHPYNWRELNELATSYKLALVEDAAEAHFSVSFGRRAGTMGDVSTFSFFGNKVLTCGEGGAVTTGDEGLSRKLALIRNQGMDVEKRFYHPVLGNNFRLNNLSAAILTAQLDRRDELLRRRERIFELYREMLAHLEGEISFQVTAPWAEVTPWLFCIVLEKHTERRDSLIQQLSHVGVETRPFFRLASEMPYFENLESTGSDFPAAKRVSQAGLNLPTSSLMNEALVEEVVRKLEKALTNSGSSKGL